MTDSLGFIGADGRLSSTKFVKFDNMMATGVASYQKCFAIILSQTDG